MQPVTITQLATGAPEAATAATYIENALERIRRRAYELFEAQTYSNDMADWLQAERELFFVPDADCIDCVDEYVVKVKVPGFGPKQLIVAAEPNWITIQGLALLDENAREMFRRINLDSAIDPEKATAYLEEEELTVMLPKAATAETASPTTVEEAKVKVATA